MSKSTPTFATTGTDITRGWSADDPRRRHYEITAPTAAMRDCVDCTLPFFSRSAANVVCPDCRAASTATFEGGVDV